MVSKVSLCGRLRFGVGSLLIFTALVAVACRAWPILRDWNLSDYHRTTLPIRDGFAAIHSELNTLDRNALPPNDWAREWAGVYNGSTLSELALHEVFAVGPSGRIAFEYQDCFWNFCGGNVGQIVDCSAEGFTIKWDFDPMKFQPDIRTRMYFVRWGPHRFLFNGYAIFRFASRYNAGGKHRDTLARVLSHRDKLESPYADYENPPTCRPLLPLRFAHLILDKPTRLVVRQIANTKEDRFIARIEADVELEGGSDQGLVDGLEIPLPEPAFDAWIELTDVRENSSSGKLTVWKREQASPFPEPGYEWFLPGAAAGDDPAISPHLAADAVE